MIKEIMNNELESEIKEGTVLVDFYAVWCGPCKMMHPIIDSVAEENPNVKVLKVNVDENEELAREYGIMTIPTIILFKDGQIKEKNVGFIAKDVLNDWLK